jgi:predicted CxxxxCH...CXXCH cytochrome family protein
MNPPITDWRDCRVWLMGASSGIGAALAQGAAPRGARVASRRATQSGMHALAELRRTGACAALRCHRRGQRCAGAGDRLAADWGGVDVAIYVAGDYVPMRAWTTRRRRGGWSR